MTTLSETAHIARLIGLVLSNRQLFACEYLEAAGFRFCVHFGTENCERLAADLFVRRLEVGGAW